MFTITQKLKLFLSLCMQTNHINVSSWLVGWLDGCPYKSNLRFLTHCIIYFCIATAGARSMEADRYPISCNCRSENPSALNSFT